MKFSVKFNQKLNDWGQWMMKLNQYLQLQQKEIYSQHLEGITSDCLCMVVYKMRPILSLYILRSRFCWWRSNHGAIWGWGRFGDIGMVWYLWCRLQTFHLKSGWLMWFSTNGPLDDWVHAVVGWASSPCLSACGGRTDAYVDCPPSD